jgi:hypothetical protein
MSQENQDSLQDSLQDEHIEEFKSQDIDGSGDATEIVQPKPIKTYELSVKDREAGEKLCHQFVNDIVQLNLPKRMQNFEEVQNVLALQQAMERFTLASMFKIVTSAVKALDNFGIDDCYDDHGSFDIGRLNTYIALQGHVMHTVAQFNLHVRQLPSVLRGMIMDAEQSQAYIVVVKPEEEAYENASQGIALTSKHSMNGLLAAAMAELAESGKDDFDGELDDFAGITKGRIETGQVDANGNMLYEYIDTDSTSNQNDSEEEETLDEL